MVAEEEGSCSEKFGVMDKMVYEIIYRDLGRLWGWAGWINCLFMSFFMMILYSTCINNQVQMKPNQIEIHKVHPTYKRSIQLNNLLPRTHRRNNSHLTPSLDDSLPILLDINILPVQTNTTGRQDLVSNARVSLLEFAKQSG